MSEIVERHMESMTEEIEEMHRTKLFSFEETRNILRKSKEFEYKINGVSKNLQDIKSYIQFEKVLLYDVKLRRAKLQIKDKKSSIEFKIQKRIRYLYEMAIERFSDDVAVYMSYLKFCGEAGYHQVAASVVEKMLKHFSHMPEAWQVAAAWHSKRDPNQAIDVIHKGIALHQNCLSLYREAIQFELSRKQSSLVTEKPSDKLCCEKIEIYLKNVFENYKDFNALLDILRLLEQHPFTKGVQDVIIKQLLDKHSDEKLVWHALAQRELQGLCYGKTEDTSKSVSVNIHRAIQKYEEGLEKIKEDKKEGLWTLYLNFLIDLRQDGKYANVIEKQGGAFLLLEIEAVFHKASEQIQMNERFYIEWAKLLDNEEEVVKVVNKGLEALPESLDLWKLQLKYAVMKDNSNEFNQIFARAIKKLKERAGPIWLLAIRYHSLNSPSETIEMIYEGALKQPKDIAQVIKPEYVEWVSINKGIGEARKLYNLLATNVPYCKQLHKVMARIESVELDRDVDEMENVLKLTSEQFGHEDVDTWTDLANFYVKNERTIKKTRPGFDLKEKLTEILTKAKATLGDRVLQLDLEEKFDAVMNCEGSKNSNI